MEWHPRDVLHQISLWMRDKALSCKLPRHWLGMLAPLLRPLSAILLERREEILRERMCRLGLLGRWRLHVIHICLDVAFSSHDARVVMRARSFLGWSSGGSVVSRDVITLLFGLQILLRRFIPKRKVAA